MPKIYIIEDDENIRELVIYALSTGGFDARGFESGTPFFEKIANDKKLPELVLLDIMLPESDGLSILKRLRSDSRYKSIPVIMMTAKGSEFDKVRGLDAGADDYVTKPFGVMELISRINAVLRRSGNETSVKEQLSYENIILDNARRAVSTGDEKITLTYKEYELLKYLLINSGIVLGRDKIMEAVWGYDFEGESRTVDVHIKTLRKKLGTAGEHIKTIRNVGYKLGE
ncbi:MAG: response regulator transcription factor [Oscillospiraceae bacterium]|nr:response regulator transcription factor [Oscillospiraceae bacterium]